MIRLAQPIMIGCVADANRGAPPPAAVRCAHSRGDPLGTCCREA